jgi:ATP-binding cassette subfamily F protein uup
VAHLLNVESVTVSFAARALLDGVSLGLDDGDRVGVVGRNGDGKSTLLRVVARAQTPDAGRVTHTRGVSVGLLGQVDVDQGLDVRHTVVGDVADHVWAADPRARDVLTGLLGGLDAPLVGGPDATVATLSGGQRRRVALARLLVAPHDVLLLDEPTNHLDVEGVAWLAGYLRRRWPYGRGGLIVVTHDRWFLDAVCTSTWEVHDGIVEAYDGGYAAYVLARAERSRVAAVTEDRRRNLIRKELAWLRRGAPARTSKPRFRLDAATALIAGEPPPRDGLALQRMATARLGKDVLDLEGVSLSVGGQGWGDGTAGGIAGRTAAGTAGGTGAGTGEGTASRTAGGIASRTAAGTAARRVLLDDVTWRLGPGDRIGLVGVNGSGKTTLLRLLLGQVSPDAGRVRRGKTVRAAILSQDVRELDEFGDLRVAEAVEQVRGSVRIGDRDVTAGQLLERLGFTRQRVWTPVAELSGGERRRLQLLRLLMGEPNVLMLDEPTNDLDTDTLTAVEDALDGWPGTLLVVSHDRYLLERVTDRQVALLGDGKVRDLPGGVEEYLRLRQDLLTADAAPAVGGAAAAPSATPSATPARNGAVAPAPATPASSGAGAADVRTARKEMARLERQLSRFAEQEERLHAELAANATDHETVLRLDATLRALAAEREQVEEAWLAAADVVG